MRRILIGITTLLILGFIVFQLVESKTKSVSNDSGEEKEVLSEPDKIAFDTKLWREKEDEDYPYRKKMLDDLVGSQLLKGLTTDKVTELLGRPLRTDKNYIFYRVDQTRMFGYPLHTTSLVLKLGADSTVNAVLIHE
jgi:hypothetical protein